MIWKYSNKELQQYKSIFLIDWIPRPDNPCSVGPFIYLKFGLKLHHCSFHKAIIWMNKGGVLSVCGHFLACTQLRQYTTSSCAFMYFFILNSALQANFIEWLLLPIWPKWWSPVDTQNFLKGQIQCTCFASHYPGRYCKCLVCAQPIRVLRNSAWPQVPLSLVIDKRSILSSMINVT